MSPPMMPGMPGMMPPFMMPGMMSPMMTPALYNFLFRQRQLQDGIMRHLQTTQRLGYINNRLDYLARVRDSQQKFFLEQLDPDPIPSRIYGLNYFGGGRHRNPMAAPYGSFYGETPIFTA